MYSFLQASLTLLSFALVGANCPSQCKCNEKTLNCEKAGLDVLPYLIPPDTERLLLANNRQVTKTTRLCMVNLSISTTRTT